MSHKISRLYALLGLAVLSSMLMSCIETSEGCLDPFATNLDMEALDPCCCTYPKLQVRINYYWGDQNPFRLLDTLNWQNDTLIVHDFAIYLSDYMVGTQFQPDSLLNLRDVVGRDGTKYRDNLVLLDLSSATLDLMTIRQVGLYDQFTYGMGYSKAWLNVDTTTMLESHDWRAPKMKVNGVKISWLLRYQLGRDSVIHSRYGNQTLSVYDQKSITLEVKQGANANWNTSLDVKTLFSDINFGLDGANEIYNHLLKNLPNAWTNE